VRNVLVLPPFHNNAGDKLRYLLGLALRGDLLKCLVGFIVACHDGKYVPTGEVGPAVIFLKLHRWLPFLSPCSPVEKYRSCCSSGTCIIAYDTSTPGQFVRLVTINHLILFNVPHRDDEHSMHEHVGVRWFCLIHRIMPPFPFITTYSHAA